MNNEAIAETTYEAMAITAENMANLANYTEEEQA
jgi:hypothetical protein